MACTTYMLVTYCKLKLYMLRTITHVDYMACQSCVSKSKKSWGKIKHKLLLKCLCFKCWTLEQQDIILQMLKKNIYNLVSVEIVEAETWRSVKYHPKWVILQTNDRGITLVCMYVFKNQDTLNLLSYNTLLWTLLTHFLIKSNIFHHIFWPASFLADIGRQQRRLSVVF